MLAIETMLKILDDRLQAASQPLQENIVPIVSAFCQLARGDKIIRKYLRMEVLPPLGHVATTRPEEGNLIRNGLVRLMTSPLEDIKVCAKHRSIGRRGTRQWCFPGWIGAHPWGQSLLNLNIFNLHILLCFVPT